MIVLRVARQVRLGKERLAVWSTRIRIWASQQIGCNRADGAQPCQAPGMCPSAHQPSQEGLPSVGTVAYWSSGLELRWPESVRNIVSLPLGLVRSRQIRRAHEGNPEAVGAGGRLLLRLAAQANGSALSAELLPIQKMAPCGWPGLKPRKLPRPPPPPPPKPPESAEPPAARQTASAALPILPARQDLPERAASRSRRGPGPCPGRPAGLPRPTGR